MDSVLQPLQTVANGKNTCTEYSSILAITLGLSTCNYRLKDSQLIKHSGKLVSRCNLPPLWWILHPQSFLLYKIEQHLCNRSRVVNLLLQQVTMHVANTAQQKTWMQFFKGLTSSLAKFFTFKISRYIQKHLQPFVADDPLFANSTVSCRLSPSCSIVLSTSTQQSTSSSPSVTTAMVSLLVMLATAGRMEKSEDECRIEYHWWTMWDRISLVDNVGQNTTGGQDTTGQLHFQGLQH